MPTKQPSKVGDERRTRLQRLLRVALTACLSHALLGCGGPTQGARPTPRDAPRPSNELSARSEAAPTGSPAVAIWRDRAVTWNDLAPAMVELAGATALRDAFLDQRLAQAAAEQKLDVSDAAIGRERTLLVGALDPDPNTAERLLQSIRSRQGLGPTRFAALLKRNAILRALVQAEVRVTPDALMRQHELLHGPKRVCRVIAVSTLAEADTIRGELERGGDFAALAVRHSTDASATRGGLLAPVSRVDPTWAESFRDAVFALPPGRTSPPTLVDKTYLLIRLEEERPADGVTLEAARGEVEASLRTSLERVLMEERARAYLAEIKPMFADERFDAAWRVSE